MKETTSDNRQSTEHLIVLDKIKEAMEVDKNALAMWVFGSVAKGSYHQGSDIDLGIVYKDFAPNYEFSTGFVDDIKVGFSRWSEDKLKHNTHGSRKCGRGPKILVSCEHERSSEHH